MGRLRHHRVRLEIVGERDEQRLGAGDRAEERQNEIGEDVTVAVQGGDAQQVGRAIREACLEAVASGSRTADLGGHLGTTEFTDEVIARVRAKLEVWASL